MWQWKAWRVPRPHTVPFPLLNENRSGAQMKGKRITVTLPVGVFELLKAQATAEKRGIGNLATWLLEKAVRDAQQAAGRR